MSSLAQRAALRIAAFRKWQKAGRIYERHRAFTMVPRTIFQSNLLLCDEKAPKTGCIVEAGVWRGGMSAGMADMMPGRLHYLFDSFEGLPPATEIDGLAALEYQKDVSNRLYYDNCRAERSFADRAMAATKARTSHIISGWFDETVPGFVPAEPVAILRLDGDWYESTMVCLTGLYPSVMQGGLIIIDDYYTWDGCARAVHDYLSARKSNDRIEQWNGVCFLIKKSNNGR